MEKLDVNTAWYLRLGKVGWYHSTLRLCIDLKGEG